MKKFISVLLCAVLLVSCLVFPASAIKLQRGKTRLKEQFKDGVAPNGMDYVYFVPENVKESVKYPLVVWLHGQSSGKEPRAQIENYRFCNWASDEYQARFADTGGAYLFLPRSNASDNTWTASGTKDLKSSIDHFISLYSDRIDTNRIYIAGYSAGGSMVYYMLSNYPGFFAAAIPICSIYMPTSGDLDPLSDVSVWLFCCDQDYYPTARTSAAKLTYNYLANRTNRPRSVRMTNVSQAIWANGTVSGGDKAQHYIWGTVTNDMHMNDGSTFMYSTTKDAAGRTITFPTENDGVISWLCQQKKPENQKEVKSTWQKIWDAILNFLKKLFLPGLN